MSRIKARLTIDVIYEGNDASEVVCRGQLRHLANTAASEGLLTGSLEMVVDTWGCTVEAEKDAKKRVYLVRYSHRHGHDVWPVFSANQPTEEEIIAGIEDFEGESRDEYVEIYGPFDLPKVTV